MVRVFHHWFSPRKAAYFLAEEAVLVVALLAGASLGPVAALGGGAATPVAPAVARAALASLFFAGALYLGDLYDLHAAVRDRADGRFRHWAQRRLVPAALHRGIGRLRATRIGCAGIDRAVGV